MVIDGIIRRHRRSALLVIGLTSFLLLFFSVPLMAAPPPQVPSLFVEVEPAPPEEALAVADQADPTVIRSRLVGVNVGLLAAPDVPEGAPRLVQLNLFDDAVFTALLERFEEGWGGALVWTGAIVGEEHGEVILVVQDAVVAANVSLPPAFYQVRFVGDGVHAVREIDQSAFPDEAEPLTAPASGGEPDAGPAAMDMAAADGSPIIDVMVVYTAAARAAAGGTANMNALINLAVSETNTGYGNSGVGQSLSLVHAAEVSYSEVYFNWGVTLDRLTGKFDGYMDEVHGWRNTYGADAVVLLVEGDGVYCGMAWLHAPPTPSSEAYAFSVVARTCATGYYSFGHELGHNMGAQHDRNSASTSGAFPYSYGYQAPDRAFRTIMAYNCAGGGCPRINHWSNPDVYVGGKPTGVYYLAPDSADNRRTLNNTAGVVAAWRIGVVPPSNLMATGSGVFRIDLTWTDNSDNEDGFRIERSLDGVGGWAEIGTVGANVVAFADYPIMCGTTFYYRVRAYRGTQYSAYSNTASAATLDCPVWDEHFFMPYVVKNY